jgi:C-terminal processing protease CtpA/Prc
MTGNKIIIILLGAICLFLIWDKFTAEPPTGPSAQGNTSKIHADALLERIQLLESDLNHELIQRQQLERRLTKLEKLPFPEQPVATSLEDTSETPRAVRNQNATEEGALSLKERLISAGMAPQTVESLQLTVDRNRLALLQLRNEAIREGWDDTPEFREKLQALRDPGQTIRDEFGEQMYDQFLYASGRANRIVVREVYSGSAAELAGLKAGDIVLSYGLSNIYSMSELRQSTLEGKAGEMVLLEIMRDDYPVTTSVPRGPLGISMNSTRVQP